MARNEEFDWIFDYVLQFLESDKFDAAVMDFVDEKCFVFDDEEENKLIYTDIHKEFCDQIEALITSNLGELGITNELFLESCEKARHDRDINSKVFERLIAMDDFQTFKKIMTKRNTELQLESLRNFQVNTPVPGKSFSRKSAKTQEQKEEEKNLFEKMMDPTELQALMEAQENTFSAYDDLDEDDIQELLMQSLMEMELVHRQEELEHAELERALNLSLAAEEDRLRMMMNGNAEIPSMGAEAKSGTGLSGGEGKLTGELKPLSAEGKAGDSGSKRGEKKLGDVSGSLSSLNSSALSDPKPLKMKMGFNPLPSIKAGSNGAADGPSMRMLDDFDEKKKLTEAALRKNFKQLADQRKKEEELRQQLAGIDPKEAERRAEHMKLQRELLISKKKAERDEKVKAEEERRAKIEAEKEAIQATVHRIQNGQDGDIGSDPSNSDVAEMRRNTMRNALARRMKMDLINSEEAKMAQMQEDQFSQLDKKLQKVDQLREDNRKREYLLHKQLERHQANIARNVRISAENMQKRIDGDL